MLTSDIEGWLERRSSSGFTNKKALQNGGLFNLIKAAYFGVVVLVLFLVVVVEELTELLVPGFSELLDAVVEVFAW